jgi:hypothetical protein
MLTFGEQFRHPPKRGRVNPEWKPRERPEATLGSQPRRAVTGPNHGGVRTAFRSPEDEFIDKLLSSCYTIQR